MLRHIPLLPALCAFALAGAIPVAGQTKPPDHVPPKRSSQITDGFGINSDLPRDPYLPWDRWWWTRMFDAGVSWIRIGQYENSSDYTSWDWVEQKRGVYQIPPGVDDYVDSLVDNGVKVQIQLHYGNPIYTSPSGVRPHAIRPAPGSFHNDDRSLYSIFWPPKTPEQIEAFMKYVKFMVEHFRGRVSYYALWNEEDIGYWNPWGNPEEYGRLLKAFVPTVHAADAQAKVVFGGQADPTREFAQRVLDNCACGAGIDVFAYHTYPGYGRNVNPEAMDYGAYGPESPAKLRELVRSYPGIRKDIPFWDDEFNSIPSWVGSDESVQAKYIPRGLVYNWAAGVRTFVWLLTAGTDGNEFDDFGFIHGLRNLPDDFTPRPVYFALQNTNALFSDTRFDPSIHVPTPDLETLRNTREYPFFADGFRSKSGKSIVAYWIGAHSEPGNVFPPMRADLRIVNSGIRNPVLVDVVTGEIHAVAWKTGTTDVLENMPLRDSVLAIADAGYFDWPVLPEAPSSLQAKAGVDTVHLTWDEHGGALGTAVVERRVKPEGQWTRLAAIEAGQREYWDQRPPAGETLWYRVRNANANGTSAYSNVVSAKP